MDICTSHMGDPSSRTKDTCPTSGRTRPESLVLRIAHVEPDVQAVGNGLDQLHLHCARMVQMIWLLLIIILIVIILIVIIIVVIVIVIVVIVVVALAGLRCSLLRRFTISFDIQETALEHLQGQAAQPVAHLGSAAREFAFAGGQAAQLPPQPQILAGT